MDSRLVATTTRFDAALAQHGAIRLGDCLGMKKAVPIRCRCGQETEARPDVILQQGYTPQCKDCRQLVLNKVQRERSPYDLEFFRQYVAKHGGTLTTDQYTGVRQTLTFVCKCGQPGTIRAFSVVHQNSNAACSACRHAAVTGENSKNYRPEAKHQRPAQVRNWYKAILQRDNYTCQITGKVGGHMSAHHLYSVDQRPDLVLELTNGVTLTRELHRRFHSTYGFGGNNPEQFAEFVALVQKELNQC